MQRVLPFAFVLGCALDPVDAGETLDSSSTTDAPPSDGGSSGATHDSSSEDTAPGETTQDDGPTEGTEDPTGAEGDSDTAAGSCMRTEDYDCDDAIDCVDFAECGGISKYDENGCGRPTCSFDSPCADGMTCVRPQTDWGECHGSGTCDDEETGTCSCFIQLDCGAEFCVPADEAPPAECLAITDMAECAAAGCDVVAATGSSVDGQSCTCEPLEVCVWLGDSAPVEAPGVYYLGNDGPYIFVEQRYEPRPLGWFECGAEGCPCLDGCGG